MDGKGREWHETKEGTGTRVPKSCDHVKDSGLNYKNPGSPLKGFTQGVTQIGQYPKQSHVITV